MSWGPFGDHNVSSLCHHGDSVGVEELTVSLANLAKLELEVAVLVEDLDPVVVGVRHNEIIVADTNNHRILVEDLDPVVVGVRHDDLIVLGDGDSTWLRELTLQDAKLSKLERED